MATFSTRELKGFDKIIYGKFSLKNDIEIINSFFNSPVSHFKYEESHVNLHLFPGKNPILIVRYKKADEMLTFDSYAFDNTSFVFVDAYTIGAHVFEDDMTHALEGKKFTVNIVSLEELPKAEELRDGDRFSVKYHVALHDNDADNELIKSHVIELWNLIKYTPDNLISLMSKPDNIFICNGFLIDSSGIDVSLRKNDVFETVFESRDFSDREFRLNSDRPPVNTCVKGDGHLVLLNGKWYLTVDGINMILWNGGNRD